jgi:hypothetical protein
MSPSPPRRPDDGGNDRAQRRTRRAQFLEFLDQVLSEEDKTRRLRFLIDGAARAVVVILFPVFLILLAVFLVIRVDLVWGGLSVLLSALGVTGVAKLRRHLNR